MIGAVEELDRQELGVTGPSMPTVILEVLGLLG